ncbi:dihydroorotase [soil metagenome]
MLIKNCQLIDSVKPKVKTDLRIDNGKIVEISTDGKELAADKSETVFDADGLWLLPGFVDIHTHLRDLGQSAKEDVATGTKSAAAGGYTTVVAMANTVPPIDNARIFSQLLQIIKEKAVIKVLPIACVTKGMAGIELTEMAILSELGAIGFSDDGLPVTNLAVMRRALEQAKALGSFIVSHPEDKDLSGTGAMNESAYATAKGLPGVPTASEAACIAREIEVVRMTGASLHFAHVSAAASIKLIERAKADGLPVTADTTPHHLTLTDSDIPEYNTNFKMNPPLRSKKDQSLLVEALKNGTLDCIATDHAPHTEGEKGMGFLAAPCGIIGLETAFALCLERLTDKNLPASSLMTASEVVRKFTSDPARIIGIAEPKIEVGAAADLTLFDPKMNWTYVVNKATSKSNNSPFDGREIKGRIVLTLCDGRVAHQFESATERWLAIEGLALK